jgi:F0F1-type ATP synthase alpha subunit
MGIPTKDVKKFQMDMLDYVRDHNGEIIHELEDKKVLTDELVEKFENLYDPDRINRCFYAYR